MCFGMDTEILMADGLKKPIKDIRIGDRIMLIHGGMTIVKNVWRGRAENLIAIEVKNGFRILVTGKQPVKTDSGLKRADALAEGDKIVIWKNNPTLEDIAALSCVKYENEVYNIEIDENCFIAGGIVVGDINLMNEMG